MITDKLMVGNFVYDTSEYLPKGYVVKITVLDMIKTENLEPIPLTDEWLDKFLNKESNYYRLGKLHDGFVFERYDQTQARIWWRGRYLGICQRLEYVHQLQQLYYILTGQDLQIKNDNK